MTKTLKTLIPDIHALFQEPHKVNRENAEAFGRELAELVTRRLEEETKPPSLRLSLVGSNCERRLWYQVNTPELGERLPPEAHIKFLYGDVVELLLLFLAREAGHRVEGVQSELEIDGVVGHRDAVVDGVLVDVKSASTKSFNKFLDGSLISDDPFGYIDQLGAYLYASQRDDLVQDKSKAVFFAMDKQLGHLAIMEVRNRNRNYEEHVRRLKNVLAKDAPPNRPYVAVPDGKGGNLKLGLVCSYCPYKHPCWGNVRTFLYSSGPRHFVRVVREPDVQEI